MRLRFSSLFLFSSLSSLAPGCGDNPSTTPTVVDPCATAAITKGPYVMRATETGASVFWETSQPGCTELALHLERQAPPSDTPETIVKGSQTAATVTGSYGVDQLPVPDAPGTFYLHQVDLTGLAPHCYIYRLHPQNGPDVNGRFCTAPTSGASFHFMAIGDTNPKLGHTTGLFPYVLGSPVPMDAFAGAPDFIVHMGDIQYYSSTETYSYWFGAMAPMLARAGSFFPAVGNHENEKEYVGSEFNDFYDRLFHRASLDGDDKGRWYRFSWGGVWFFTVDTEEPYDAGSPQYQWLEAGLREVTQKPGFRFSVVYMHRNLYTLGDSNPQMDLRATLGPIFVANKVRLVLSGHMHGYERFEVGDITYVTTAGGGGVIGDVNQNVPNFPADVPLRKAAAPAYHALLVDVTPTSANATSLHLRAVGCDKDACTKPADYGRTVDEATREIP